MKALWEEDAFHSAPAGRNRSMMSVSQGGAALALGYSQPVPPGPEAFWRQSKRLRVSRGLWLVLHAISLRRGEPGIRQLAPCLVQPVREYFCSLIVSFHAMEEDL